MLKSPLINPLPDKVKVEPPTKDVVVPDDNVAAGKVNINSQGQLAVLAAREAYPI